MLNENINVTLLLISMLGFLFSCDNKENINMECTFSDKWLLESNSIPTEFNQNDFFFVNENIGYSVGHAGSIIRTLNGGNSWEKINDRNFKDKITVLKLTSVFFINEDVGYIGGERKDFGSEVELKLGAILIKTLDGGSTWSKKYFNTIKRFSDFVFFDHLNGIALVTMNEDSLNSVRKSLSTTDGGETWQEILVPGIEFKSYAIEYKEEILFVLAKDNLGNSIIAISVDKGRNWNSINLPEQECNRIIFINSQIGFLTCGNLFLPERVYKTIDQGSSWTFIENSPINNYSIVHFVSEEHGIVLNNVLQWVQSGVEWMEVLVSYDFFETTNGGEDWSNKELNRSCNFDGIGFDLNASIFYIMGEKFSKFELQ